MPASAQNGTATITGTVTDPTGSVVPDATITIRNVETGVSQRLLTGATGNYSAVQLPVGVYNVSASKAGFSAATRTAVRLNIADVARVDLSLQVGSASTSVTVRSSTVEMNTENADVSTTISDKMVADLPLNGRNFMELQLLDGTGYETANSVMGQFRPTQTLADGGTVGIGGARQTSQGYLIDGLNNRDIGYGSVILIPSIDALQEFKMQTKTYSAEFGGSANQIQLHFKSGTNALHGTAYEFVRNNDFDARGFLETTVPTLNQNQFGYSLGGPIIIPHLYDGRDKSFFFANYEGLRVKMESAPVYLTVPTTDQWNGQFSTTIVDPYTGVPFADDQVPSGRISQFATQFKKFVLPSNTSSVLGNWVGSLSTPTVSDQQNYRFDENFNSSNSAFFRYSTSTTNATTGGPNGTGIYNQTIDNASSQAYQISYTHIFNPNFVNNATYGHVQSDFNTYAPQITASDLAGFGIQGGFTDQPNPEVPEVIFNGLTAIAGFGTNENWPQIDATQYWNGSDTLTLIHRQHSIGVGISVLSWDHVYGKGANLGQWTFNGQYSGDPFADFLLGNPSAISIDVPSPLAPTAASAVFDYPQFTYAPYVEDQWKVSPRLTLNLGLRYEFYQQAHEANGRYMWLNPAVSGGGECTANKTAATDVGQNGLLTYCGNYPRPTPKHSFAPRFGLAYLPTNDEKTVIRAGFGIFYDQSDEADTVNASDNYPYLGSQGFNGTPVTDILSTSMPIPPITSLRPVQASDLGFVFLGTDHKRDPYLEEWSLSVEHTVWNNTVVEVGYQGSLGRLYPTRYNLNQPFQYDPANPLPVSERRPYPNFGEAYAQTFELPSSYNAGTISVKHQSHSLLLTAAYTYSKSLDERSASYGAGPNDINGWAGPMDSHNFRLDYGPSSFDIRHRAVIGFVHQIPVGRGQQFLSNLNRPANAVIGGWQWNGIATFQTGFPFSIQAADVDGLIDTYVQRANIVGNPYPSGFHKSTTEWFNTAAFAQPAPGFFGDSGRNILTAPGYVNFDLSVIKEIGFADWFRLQIRGEAFNTFNHTNYGFPNFDLTSTGFGTISSAAPARIFQLGMKAIW